MCRYAEINCKPRSEWERLIREWIYDERDRKLLARVLLDGVSVESCGDEIGLQRRQTQRRFKRAFAQLLAHK